MKLSAEIKLFIEDLASLPDPKELLVTFGKVFYCNQFIITIITFKSNLSLFSQGNYIKFKASNKILNYRFKSSRW